MAADKNASAAPKRLRVTLVRGLMGKKPDHRATVAGLGLKWRSHSVEVADTPEIRGMLHASRHLLRVEEEV